jgi:hypothetical protein
LQKLKHFLFQTGYKTTDQSTILKFERRITIQLFQMTTINADANAISREELEGLHMLMASHRTSKPIKIDYNNIVVHGFHSSMKMNPRSAFDKILEGARPKIDKVMASLVGVKHQGDNWTIVSQYLTIHVCLHCHTFYDCSESAFEDTAHHRVSISVTAGFDAKYVYRTDKRNEEVFKIVNKLYCDLIGAFHNRR